MTTCLDRDRDQLKHSSTSVIGPRKMVLVAMESLRPRELKSAKKTRGQCLASLPKLRQNMRNREKSYLPSSD